MCDGDALVHYERLFSCVLHLRSWNCLGVVQRSSLPAGGHLRYGWPCCQPSSTQLHDNTIVQAFVSMDGSEQDVPSPGPLSGVWNR